MKEIWRDIPEYEGYYQVSNLGNVKSLSRYVKGNIGQPKIIYERILKPVIRGKYLSVRLCKFHKTKSYNIHRLVAISFLENKYNYPCINHKDENKLNNNVNNLEWCSYSYNIHYGTCLERIGKSNSISHLGKVQPKLEKSNKSVNIMLINNEDIIKGAKTASLKYGISASNIIQCCKGKRKSAGKFKNEPAIWKYI